MGVRVVDLRWIAPLPVDDIVREVTDLAVAGVTEVTLALGFKPEPFVDAFPDGTCSGVTLKYAVEPEPLDTAGAIRFAAEYAGIDDTFIVANGDVLTDLDVSHLVAFHSAHGAEATLHLIGVPDPSAFGVVALDADDRVELPHEVAGLTDVVSVVATGVAAALKKDGTVWVWGHNGQAQFGKGGHVRQQGLAFATQHSHDVVVSRGIQLHLLSDVSEHHTKFL